MTILKFFGSFREMEASAHSEASIADFVSTEPQENEERIIQYLKQGAAFIAHAGVTFDVINRTERPIGTASVLTDGIWAWRGDLAYYVSKYHLKVDNDFVDHMKANNWKCPPESEIDFDNLDIRPT